MNNSSSSSHRHRSHAHLQHNSITVKKEPTGSSAIAHRHESMISTITPASVHTYEEPLAFHFMRISGHFHESSNGPYPNEDSAFTAVMEYVRNVQHGVPDLPLSRMDQLFRCLIQSGSLKIKAARPDGGVVSNVLVRPISSFNSGIRPTTSSTPKDKAVEIIDLTEDEPSVKIEPEFLPSFQRIPTRASEGFVKKDLKRRPSLATELQYTKVSRSSLLHTPGATTVYPQSFKSTIGGSSDELPSRLDTTVPRARLLQTPGVGFHTPGAAAVSPQSFKSAIGGSSDELPSRLDTTVPRARLLQTPGVGFHTPGAAAVSPQSFKSAIGGSSDELPSRLDTTVPRTRLLQTPGVGFHTPGAAAVSPQSFKSAIGGSSDELPSRLDTTVPRTRLLQTPGVGFHTPGAAAVSPPSFKSNIGSSSDELPSRLNIVFERAYRLPKVAMIGVPLPAPESNSVIQYFMHPAQKSLAAKDIEPYCRRNKNYSYLKYNHKYHFVCGHGLLNFLKYSGLRMDDEQRLKNYFKGIRIQKADLPLQTLYVPKYIAEAVASRCGFLSMLMNLIDYGLSDQRFSQIFRCYRCDKEFTQSQSGYDDAGSHLATHAIASGLNRPQRSDYRHVVRCYYSGCNVVMDSRWPNFEEHFNTCRYRPSP